MVMFGKDGISLSQHERSPSPLKFESLSWNTHKILGGNAPVGFVWKWGAPLNCMGILYPLQSRTRTSQPKKIKKANHRPGCGNFSAYLSPHSINWYKLREISACFLPLRWTPASFLQGLVVTFLWISGLVVLAPGRSGLSGLCRRACRVQDAYSMHIWHIMHQAGY